MFLFGFLKKLSADHSLNSSYQMFKSLTIYKHNIVKHSQSRQIDAYAHFLKLFHDRNNKSVANNSQSGPSKKYKVKSCCDWRLLWMFFSCEKNQLVLTSHITIHFVSSRRQTTKRIRLKFVENVHSLIFFRLVQILLFQFFCWPLDNIQQRKEHIPEFWMTRIKTHLVFKWSWLLLLWISHSSSRVVQKLLCTSSLAGNLSCEMTNGEVFTQNDILERNNLQEEVWIQRLMKAASHNCVYKGA